MAGQVSQMDGVGRGGCGRCWAGRLWTPWLSFGPQGRQGDESSGPSPCEPLSHHSWTSPPPSHCIPGHSVRPCALPHPAHSGLIRGVSRLAGIQAWGTLLGTGWLRAPPSHGCKDRSGQSHALEAGPYGPSRPPFPGHHIRTACILLWAILRAELRTSSRQQRAIPLSLDTHTAASRAKTRSQLLREARGSAPPDGASSPWLDVRVPGCWVSSGHVKRGWGWVLTSRLLPVT